MRAVEATDKARKTMAHLTTEQVKEVYIMARQRKDEIVRTWATMELIDRIGRKATGDWQEAVHAEEAR